MAGEAVATAVVEEAVRSCFDMCGRYISYTRKYKKNINILQVELKKLEANKETILNEVEIAKRNAQDIRPDVLRWQQTCDELETKANELLQTSRPFNMSCLCCSCPNIKSRYLSSTEAAELTSSITQHLVEGRFDRVGQQPQLDQLPLLSPGEYHGFGSRTIIKKEVIDCLKDDSITVIGLSGMGGVGKTTLVKKIAEEVKNEKLFDEVAFVVVSQNVNVKAIQEQLASRLDLKDIEKKVDDQGRAELLYKRLMDEKKKILVILDDIWQELNLRSVGIPVHGDRKGFKILMTSRYDSVCVDMKGQQRLSVGILSEDEAWNLFMITSEISDDDTILETAKQVSKECDCLPLAIVVVGKSLRNKKEHSFSDVLRRLRNPSSNNTSGIHSVLYLCIKSSYDYLESDEHRSVLLLCSLYPEDFEIQVEDLVRYSRGLSDTFESMKEARDRVEHIIDELMGCYLLLPCEEDKCVTLHDVVRDVCISIASESGNVNIFSEFDDLRNKVSSLKIQRLSLLRLVNEKAIWKYPYMSRNRYLEVESTKEMKFSKDMQEVRVLEVNLHTYIGTISLPTSLQFMFNLHTLALDYCRLKGNFTGIGSLKMLRVLSFFNSIIEMFPMEIAELTNLQCLDLRFDINVPATLPFGVLSGLSELEELFMGHHISGNNEIIKELCSLSKLHTFQCFVHKDDSSLDLLLKNLNLSELTRFNIKWGGHDYSEYQIIENVLHLTGKISDINLLKRLMRRVNSFELNGEGLVNLRYLKLHKCDMKYLVDANKHLPNGYLGKLEELRITNASQLEELIHGIQCPLGNLSILIISGSDKLRSLFSKSMVNCPRKLKSIKVHACPLFERIVTSIEDDEQVDCLQVSQFQALRELKLINLPEFRSFGPQPGRMSGFNQMIPELEVLKIKLSDSVKERQGETEQKELCFYLGCSLPKLRLLDIRECNNLVTIAKYGLLHGFQNLEKLKVWECSSLEVVFDFEEIISSAESDEETSFLGRLDILDLKSLPKLKHIWRMLPKQTPIFRNLKKIKVENCGSLRYLFTPTVANMLVNLEKIRLVKNELMEAIIGMDENYISNDGDVFGMGRIVLPKLKSLTVWKLPSFRKLCCCSPDLVLEFPSLSKLNTSFMLEDLFTRDQIWGLTSVSLSGIGVGRYPLTPSLVELLLNIKELNLGDYYGYADADTDHDDDYDDYDYELQKVEINELVEAIIGSEKSEATKGYVVFPELQKVEINGLSNLRKFCFSPDLTLGLPSLMELYISYNTVDILTTETHALQNLTKLVIHKCGSFKYLFISSAQVLVHLEELDLCHNKSMEAIFGYESSHGEEIPNITILLPKLRKLDIEYLKSFRMICCSSNINVELPSLTELCIEECPNMSKLCAGQLTTPLLTDVINGWNKKIDVGTFINYWLKDQESMIRCLNCSYRRSKTCHHLDDQRKESEAMEESSNATGSSHEKSLVMNTHT